MAKFRYKYADVACVYCLYYKNYKHIVCPHILENLYDLKRDKAFQEAITNADSCDNKHKRTLLNLKNDFHQVEG